MSIINVENWNDLKVFIKTHTHVTSTTEEDHLGKKYVIFTATSDDTSKTGATSDEAVKASNNPNRTMRRAQKTADTHAKKAGDDTTNTPAVEKADTHAIKAGDDTTNTPAVEKADTHAKKAGDDTTNTPAAVSTAGDDTSSNKRGDEANEDKETAPNEDEETASNEDDEETASNEDDEETASNEDDEETASNKDEETASNEDEETASNEDEETASKEDRVFRIEIKDTVHDEAVNATSTIVISSFVGAMTAMLISCCAC
jgi:hypothetical protein